MLRRSTLIVLIVFLVLMGVVVYLQYADEHPGTTAESTPNADFLSGSDATANTNATVQAFEELFDFPADAVTGLQVVAADGRTLVMEKNADGAFVLTCAITGVVSGKASISMYRNDHTPATVTAATPIKTTARFRNEKLMIQLSI